MLCVRHHNWWYAYPFRWQWPGDVIHALHALAMLAFPILLALGFMANPQASVIDFTSPAGTILTCYILLCCFVAMVVFPLITLQRLCHKIPSLQSNDTTTRDIARELGHRPINSSRHLWLTMLPRNEIFQVDFTEKTLTLPTLPPEWDGLSILHLSDLHFIGVPGRLL